MVNKAAPELNALQNTGCVHCACRVVGNLDNTRLQQFLCITGRSVKQTPIRLSKGDELLFRQSRHLP